MNLHSNLTVTDMHTGGEPLRIITGGYPDIPPGTILEKRAYVRDNLDHLRRVLVFEPRGHFDMYGALLVEPDLPGADIAVLFMHNEGYSTMCGHAIMALGRYAVDEGMVESTEPYTTVNIECPCGMVAATVEVKDGKTGAVTFDSVPAFLFASDQVVDLPGSGEITFDISYGGAFYALVDAGQFGLKFGSSRVRDLVDAAVSLTGAAKDKVPLSHPDHDDLAFLYGTIITDGGNGEGEATRNICVFADEQVDRSPTGSGVTARMAAMYAKGRVKRGDIRTFESITGSRFEARIASGTKCGDHQAVVVSVSGRAHYMGRSEFIIEDDDPLCDGFLVR